MSVTRQEVERIARLAELHVDDAALPALTEQLSRILEYVSQIAAVPGTETVQPFTPGPVALRFRSDEVLPVPLALSPAQLAPSFKEGFFLVPRLGAFDAGAAGGDDVE
ncbi:MAG TPA: Asp-tRNA(Asn)/Glu-tRNA(Gln) amidotransferase subunit GatC [Gemmatimonadales bacterium]|nr:Asp-tRNA(Asn)/Glu-tRNA(Gln) amidotransferase subunit GatC [Gemmatimonadales bacterium]